MELEKKDVEILVEALDAWECSESKSEMMTDVLTIMLIKDKAESKKMLAESKEKIKESEKSKKEISTMIKAKLYIIKEKIK